tara:strand:- start:7251 stop:7982 length:732 start_codon:yes stop_codon:yes gene_type:complete
VSYTNQCGFIYSLPFEEYKILPGLNQSKLRKLLSSPIKQKQGDQIQQAMNFGNAGHCLLLEPHKFAELYVCAPKGLQRRGKKGRKYWEEFCELNKGKNVLDSTEWERLQKILNVFQINPKIRRFWKHGETEVSMFWEDTELDLECKARMDWFDTDSMKIVDLKFTNNIARFSNQKLMDQHFSVQAAWYRRGVYNLTGSKCDFLFVFVEKYSPHIIGVIQASEQIIMHGEQAILNATKRYIKKT